MITALDTNVLLDILRSRILSSDVPGFAAFRSQRMLNMFETNLRKAPDSVVSKAAH